MSWIIKTLTLLSLRQLLLLCLAVLKAIAEKTKGTWDNEAVLFIEQVISNFNEYSKKI